MKFLVTILSLITLLALGCSQPLAAPSGSARSASGSLSISIPAIAPWLAEALTKQEAGNRAFLHAGKAEVTLLQQVATTGDASQDWSVVAGPVALTFAVDASGTSLSGEIVDLPPGHGYRLKVSIWAQSSDPNPVVEGITDDVYIGVNKNQVGVTCRPVAAIPLDLTAGSPVTVATTTLGVNSESWYALKVNKNAYYQFASTSTNGTVGFSFSENGNLWQTYENGNTFTLKAWDSGIVYFGVSGGKTAAGTFGLTAQSVPGSSLTGQIAFPPGSEEKKFRLTTWSDNGFSWSHEEVVGVDLNASVALAGLPPGGLYTFVGKMEATAGSWSGDSSGPAKAGDWAMKTQAFYSNGFDPVTLTPLAAADWSLFAGVSWSGSQYAIEPGAQLVVGIDRRPLGEAIINLWNQKHPEAPYAVRFMDIGSDTALDHNKSRDGLQSDVTLTIQNSVLLHRERLMPLDTNMASIQAELDPTLLQWVNATFHGQTLGLPIAYDGMAFAWNKTMLEALGYDAADIDGDGLPDAFDTWEEIFVLSNAWSNKSYLNNPVTVVYPLSLDEPWSGFAGMSAGGWRLFEAGDVSQPGFDTPAFLKGLAFLKEASNVSLSRQGDGSKTPGGAMGWRWDSFLNDRLSPFGMVGTWMDVQGAKTKSGDTIVISRMPTWEGVRLAPLMKAKVFAVNKGTYFPSAAMELLRILYTPEGIQALVNSTAYVPTLKVGSSLTPTIDSAAPQSQFAKAFATSALEPLNLVLPSGKAAMDVYYNIGINKDYRDVWDGYVTPEQAQQRVVDKARDWLSRN